MRRILMCLTFILLVTSTWLALTAGQVEYLVKNLVYFHVPSSISALLCFALVLIGGIGFLFSKKLAWDHFAAAAAEVGLVCACVLNLTGSVFSREQWGTWWTPEPRLITSAILWFLYVAYLILRASITSARRRAQICAVFGIIAFLDVPMVYISARFIQGMHPKAATFTSDIQNAAFGLSILGVLLLVTVLIWLKYDILKNKAALEEELFS